MNSSPYIVQYIETMSMHSSKQCPNCKHWFTTQKLFKHHIRHCRKTKCEHTLNNVGISAANPLLSNFTLAVQSNVFQQSNLTQSFDDDYFAFQQIESSADSNYDSDSWVNNNEDSKDDMDDKTSLVRLPVSLEEIRP